MKHEKIWREFLLSIVILIMMSVIVYLSFLLEDKSMEVERLQRKVWEYQEKNTQPLDRYNDFKRLHERFINDGHR